MSKEAAKSEVALSKAQLLDLRIETLRALDAALAEKLALAETQEGAEAVAANKASAAQANATGHNRWARLPLTDAIPEYLSTCKQPQTARQIAAALLKAGREFETNKPVHSVRTALKKIMAVNDDVFHVTWAKYHLKSKYRKSQLEKLLAKNARFGTGGHTAKEHGRRTAEGIAKRHRESNASWGPRRKATPELIERAKQMMRDGITLTETAKMLGVAIPTLYQFGIRQRALKKEGQLRKELPLGEPTTESGNIVQFAKGNGATQD